MGRTDARKVLVFDQRVNFCESTRRWHLDNSIQGDCNFHAFRKIRASVWIVWKNSVTAIRSFATSRRRLVVLLNLFKTQPSSSLRYFASAVASDSYVRDLRMTHKDTVLITCVTV